MNRFKPMNMRKKLRKKQILILKMKNPIRSCLRRWELQLINILRRLSRSELTNRSKYRLSNWRLRLRELWNKWMRWRREGLAKQCLNPDWVFRASLQQNHLVQETYQQEHQHHVLKQQSNLYQQEEQQQPRSLLQINPLQPQGRCQNPSRQKLPQPNLLPSPLYPTNQ